jgi:LysR family transcriptional activator of nhaA
LKSALASRGRAPLRPFRVGITDVVPKAIAYRLLEPAARLDEPVRLVCREGKLERLLAELALHRLELVIADRPLPPNVNVRGYSHKLGESEIAVFASPQLAERCRDFPRCLDNAPFFLPGDDATVRGHLERWLEDVRVAPRVTAEFDDSALMKAFGQAGGGYFPAPTVLAPELEAHYGVRLVGRIESVREAFYAITAERRATHPAVKAVIEGAGPSLSAV